MKVVFFDAFATLIRPRKPVAQQYAEIFGLYPVAGPFHLHISRSAGI